MRQHNSPELHASEEPTFKMAAIVPPVQSSPKTNGNTVESLEIPDTAKASKVVTIYRQGSPVIRVERGTTLGVLKLLYESEGGQQQILGVRPQKNGDSIPCIITLDESKLTDPCYDILIHDKSPLGQDKSEREKPLYNQERYDKYATAKCIDCSRESWKSKKFTTTGMNTEVSVNPSIEMDLRVFSGINGTNSMHYGHPPPANSTSYNGRLTRLRSTVMRQPPGPVAPPPPAIVHVNSTRKDIQAAALPAIQVNSIKSISTSADPELARQGEPSPSIPRSPNREIMPGPYTSFQGTQISYPRVTGAFHSEIRYDQPPPPLRSPHGRSPHDIPRSPSHMNGDVAGHHGHLQPSAGIKEDTPDGNPTVYVLPNDFDLNGGYDSHFSAYCPVSHDDIRRHDEMRRHEEMRRQRESRRNEEKRIEDAEIIASKRVKQEAIPSFALPTQVNLNESDVVKSDIKYSPQNSNTGSPSSIVGENDSPISNENSHSQKLYCKICHKVFATKSLLYKHLRGHTSDEKPYKCPECGQGFTLSSNLRQHRIIHRGYKPFQCEFCGKKFMRSNVYKQHRRIHTGEEMYKCSMCPSEFLQKYALVKHMKKQHDVDTGDSM